jgi:hypothetical protein
MILTPFGRIAGTFPFEVVGSYQSNNYLCPPDPQYFSRATYGLYHDTPLGGRSIVSRKAREANKNGLGAIPTDAEIGKHYYSWYTPVQSNWVYTNQGYLAPPVIPSPTEIVTGDGVLRLPANGLGETTGDEVAKAVMDELRSYHTRQFGLSALSTAVVVASSLITIYRTIQLINEEKKKQEKVA